MCHLSCGLDGKTYTRRAQSCRLTHPYPFSRGILFTPYSGRSVGIQAHPHPHHPGMVGGWVATLTPWRRSTPPWQPFLSVLILRGMIKEIRREGSA